MRISTAIIMSIALSLTIGFFAYMHVRDSDTYREVFSWRHTDTYPEYGQIVERWEHTSGAVKYRRYEDVKGQQFVEDSLRGIE